MIGKLTGDQKSVSIRFGLVIIEFDRVGVSAPSRSQIHFWLVLK
jgi:hypothetical protein